MKTDMELRDDVLAEIEWEPTVAGGEIGVTAKSGVVTLSGKVGSYFEKTQAIKAAERIAGVTAVADELEVAWGPTVAPNDTDIAAALKAAFASHAGVPATRIHPVVHDGYITLEGEVDFEFQRAMAKHAAESLPGVRGVINLIHLAERPVTPSEVKSKIESAFRRRADIDARRISVRVEGGTAILEGTVPTALERQAAVIAAWGGKGVRNVEDHIRVNPGLL